MRLSQKTCLRSAYRIFGLKRDMFLTCAAAGLALRVVLAMLHERGIYRLRPVYPAFLSDYYRENSVFPSFGAVVAERAALAGTRRQRA